MIDVGNAVSTHPVGWQRARVQVCPASPQAPAGSCRFEPVEHQASFADRVQPALDGGLHVAVDGE